MLERKCIIRVQRTLLLSAIVVTGCIQFLLSLIILAPIHLVSYYNIHCVLDFIQIPITLHKETVYDQEGREVHRCGFKIGGGIDQDYRKSPQNYSDNVSLFMKTILHMLFIHTLIICIFQGIYVTEVQENSPAVKAGLRVNDKILQV